MTIEVINNQKWGTASKAEKAFGLTRRRIEDFDDQGLIRTLKMGDAKQAPKLYCFADLDELLKILAAGRKPRVKRGKI